MRPAPAETTAAPAGPCASAVEPHDLAPLLDLLRRRDGIDLSGYRLATVARRVRSRMTSAGERTLAGYLARLREDPAETGRLVDRLTVKVSRFWRNAEAVEAVSRALADELARAPRRLAAWSAGCGRGEEPYTIGLLLAALGQPAEGPPAIVATDLDPLALAAAARAVYPEALLEEVPPALRARHLLPAAAGGAGGEPVLAVSREIRRRVSFARHDLAQAERPPPPGRFDLVACRNTLIYFELPLQVRVLSLLVSALAPGGLLWLGEAEWPAGEVARRLVAVDRRARLFRLPEDARGA